jgi:multiple sugar transport system permease protein
MKKKTKNTVGKVVLYSMLILLSFCFLLPLIWMIRSAFMDAAQIFIVPPVWLPDPIKPQNFSKAIRTVPLLIVVFNVTGTVLTSSICAYSFARLRFPGRKLFFGLLMSGMMLPYTVTLIPTFLLWRSLVGANSYLPLIIPAWFGGGAFNIFLQRQFMMTIPFTLDEAALIDGASYPRILASVILPLSRSSAIVVGLFQFMAVWNDYLGPLIYVNKESRFTLALGLQQFIGYYTAQWELLMAAATLILIQPIIIFLMGQKYFIQGIVLSGLKE